MLLKGATGVHFTNMDPTSITEGGMKLLIHSQTLMEQPLKFVNG